MINKTEFVAYYAENNEISRAQSKREIDRFLDTLVKATADEGGVNLIGYLKTEVVDVAARDRVNPQNGKKIKCPAKKSVKIRRGTNFKKIFED